MLCRVSASFVRPLRRLSGLAKALDPVQEASLAEECILVDADDRPVGSASKRDCHRVGPGGGLLLHRAFSVFLFNSSGELLLQKRSRSKITFPDSYTNSCCSHPLHCIEAEREEEGALGVRLAAKRRLNHELGVPLEEVDPSDLRYLTRILYKSTGDGVWGEHEVDYILFMRKDVTIDPNPAEVSEVRYVGRDNFDRFLRNLKCPLTPWFQLISQTHLKVWWDNINNLSRFEDHKNIIKF